MLGRSRQDIEICALRTGHSVPSCRGYSIDHTEAIDAFMLVLLDSYPLHLANIVFANSTHKSWYYNLTLYSYATSFSNTPYPRGLHLILPKQFHVHLHTRQSHWIASDDC